MDAVCGAIEADLPALPIARLARAAGAGSGGRGAGDRGVVMSLAERISAADNAQ
ncbi:hypothetical protein [Nannocystis bainbridge]|uniref:Uncharacterized protein n=1 Tax=Nannocystis bainbridge TaxID=2995303 RepID=A0ABT5EBJ4_9BACT|nr:hypothetical protein [Nannocystis bainbridge]MDC0723231.1 hypothetical protein [Nannocystis bainbridge]